MNEKIKQLAEQADIHFGRSATLDGRNIARFVTASDMEKFAELLILECIAIHEDDYGVDIIGAVLKKHFGVE